MTEDEAKTKWCPFARIAVFDVPVNRWKQSAPPEEPYALNPFPCRCIASACMAWRRQTERTSKPAGLPPEGDGWVMEGEGGHGGAVTHLAHWKRVGGYCGLAGDPRT